MWHSHVVKSAFLSGILSHFALTISQQMAILARRTFPSQESIMSDEKLKALRQSHALHPHPEGVRDPLFTIGSPFFDPHDLVQVKYELLRRVRVDGDSVSHATSLFALSRPTFYAALAAWERSGLLGLLPEPTGPRQAHKLTEEVLVLLRPLANTMSSTQRPTWVREDLQLLLHPPTIKPSPP